MSTDVFPGPLQPMPQAPENPGELRWPPPEYIAPPRFVDGIDLFVAAACDAGEDPARLAGDLGALWDFIVAHPELIDTAESAEATARFLGNAIAVAHPAATWRFTREPEVGTSTRSFPILPLPGMIVEHPERRSDFLEVFDTWEQHDRDDAEVHALGQELSGPELVPAEHPFTLPELPSIEYRDDDGEIIEYGRRWNGAPPEDAYSRVTHPERFAPLLLVVDALIDHLTTAYVVDVEEQTDADGARQVHLRPSTGAEITLTAQVEAVHIRAGATFRTFVPDCTCDACDETAESEAERLVEIVLGIAAGGLREVFPVGERRWVFTQTRTLDGLGGSSSGALDPGAGPAERVIDMLRPLDDGHWPAWALRPSDDHASGKSLLDAD